MRIERLENSKRKQERVLVHLEDGNILRITGAELLQFGLYQGLDLTPEMLAEVFRVRAELQTLPSGRLNIIYHGGI